MVVCVWLPPHSHGESPKREGAGWFTQLPLFYTLLAEQWIFGLCPCRPPRLGSLGAVGLGVGGGRGGPFGRARGPVVGGWAGGSGLLAGCLVLVPWALSAASLSSALGGLVWFWGLLALWPFGPGGLC